MFTLNQAIFPGALSAEEFRILYSYMVAQENCLLGILLQKDLAKWLEEEGREGKREI